MTNEEIIKSDILASIEVKQKVVNSPEILKSIEKMAVEITDCIKTGGKLLICGNGGSASDALHIAGEIVGRFQQERKGYAAIALNSDVAIMTAVANDYGYDQVFARQVEALMDKDDILLGISTSGNSENIIRAVYKAHEIGGKAFALTGEDGGKLKEICDISFVAPSDVTAHIQEMHECAYHIICKLVEQNLM